MNTSSLQLRVGVKTDPIEYRYSYEWLFRLMAEEGVHDVQIGTFFELYHLPDDYFRALRTLAAAYGIRIGSVFSAHRELGGFFRFDHPAWEQVSRRQYERLIAVGALLGAEAVGANAGSVLRDHMAWKEAGWRRFLYHMKELMHVAHTAGLAYLTIEPMSCLAEPPTLPDEIVGMAEELQAYHQAYPDSTAAVGYCVDIAHGYADRDGRVVWDNMQLLEVALPYLHHLHLKNTDGLFQATWGFGEAERARGIVDVAAVRDRLLAAADRLPMREVVGYLEIGGPKLGRDYADYRLEAMLRESLRHLKATFERLDVPSYPLP
ncbi:MAG: sugar phosphate isomerase/epimerase [Caldilineales bacterium]|nr:sugar phosphate isomerase/epimerase [Caldilineales bacterium]